MKLSDELREFARVIWQRQEIGSFIEPPPIDTSAVNKAADELDRLTAKEAEWQAVFGLSEKWAHEKDSADVERRLRRLAESIRNGTANASENFDLIDTVIRRLDLHRHERARHDALTNHWRKHDLPRPTYWQTEDGLRIIELQDEINRLASALPKTADGVTIVPGMEVFCLLGDGSIHPATICDVEKDAATAEDETTGYCLGVEQYYSTRQAAEEAART